MSFRSGLAMRSSMKWRETNRVISWKNWFWSWVMLYGCTYPSSKGSHYPFEVQRAMPELTISELSRFIRRRDSNGIWITLSGSR